MTHELKEIPGHMGYYANCNGEIFSAWTHGPNSRIDITKMHKKISSLSSSGYLFVVIKGNGKRQFSGFVHRLVTTAFRGIPKKGMTASHLNGNKKDNKIENLIWESLQDNNKRKFLHGTSDVGSNNSRASLKKEQIPEIKKLLKEGNLTHKEIGKKFGVERWTISQINIGKRYKYE